MRGNCTSQRDNTGLDDVTGLLTNLNLEEELDIKERSKELEAATLHIKQAVVQRKLANTRIQEEIDDVEKSHGEQRHIFIADYCQNMELQLLGASQPGDTYYFALLKINVFGIVDCSIFGGSLGAHVYDEGQGKKGGNNVASLLIKDLREKNLLRDNKPGK